VSLTLSYAETTAIEAFLGYLHGHYSTAINSRDTYLIAAVGAWFRQESGSLSRVIGNNPFNIRSSPLQSGTRTTLHNGHFAVFSSLSKGFEAAAYLLIHGSASYGYQLALNAMKKGGNQAAVDFLAAIAMSSWDAAHYGAANWAEAFDPKQNHILGLYLTIGGIQLQDPHPRVKPRKRPPVLPRPHFALPEQHAYVDPWVSAQFYRSRRRHADLQRKVDTASRRG